MLLDNQCTEIRVVWMAICLINIPGFLEEVSGYIIVWLGHGCLFEVLQVSHHVGGNVTGAQSCP